MNPQTSPVRAMVDRMISEQISAAQAASCLLDGLLEGDASYPDAPGLSKEDMAVAAHKGAIHARGKNGKPGKLHPLTDRQRRFFFAKMGGEKPYRAALARAKNKKD